MNNWDGIGRLTAEPIIRWSTGEKSMCVARYTLAVPRQYQKGGEQTADFIQCVAFGKTAENTEKYVHKGTKLAVNGRIKTGSFTDKDGKKVYTTEVYVTYQEFVESKTAAQQNAQQYSQPVQQQAPQQPQSQAQQPQFMQNSFAGTQPAAQQQSFDGFMSIPDGIDEELPFA